MLTEDEDEAGRLASELEADPLEPTGGDLGDVPAGLGVAGEADDLGVRTGHQRVADGGAEQRQHFRRDVPRGLTWREFLEELKYFPLNIRARGGLAMLYQAGDKPDAAAAVLADMLRLTPTPDSYALAARLYTMFGNRTQAENVKAEAKRTFTATRERSVRR